MYHDTEWYLLKERKSLVSRLGRGQGEVEVEIFFCKINSLGELHKGVTSGTRTGRLGEVESNIYLFFKK